VYRAIGCTRSCLYKLQKSSLGTWEGNDETNVPVGLDANLYANYKTLVVKGSHVTASVVQAPDIEIPAEGDESKQTQTTGQITLARTAELIDATKIPTTAEMKTWFGQKTRNFQLGGNLYSAQSLTKNAYVSNGYSAKRQWNSNPNARFDQMLNNDVGAGDQDVDDPTHMYIIIKPRKDIDASELPLYLKPMYVTVKVTYICQFQDPDKIQSVPLPMSTGSKYTGNKRKFGNKKRGYTPNAFGTFGMSQLAGMLAMAPAYYGALRGRQNPRLQNYFNVRPRYVF